MINLLNIFHTIVNSKNHLALKKAKTFESPKNNSFFFASGFS